MIAHTTRQGKVGYLDDCVGNSNVFLYVFLCVFLYVFLSYLDESVGNGVLSQHRRGTPVEGWHVCKPPARRYTLGTR